MARKVRRTSFFEAVPVGAAGWQIHKLGRPVTDKVYRTLAEIKRVEHYLFHEARRTYERLTREMRQFDYRESTPQIAEKIGEPIFGGSAWLQEVRYDDGRRGFVCARKGMDRVGGIFGGPWVECPNGRPQETTEREFHPDPEFDTLFASFLGSKSDPTEEDRIEAYSQACRESGLRHQARLDALYAEHPQYRPDWL